MGGGGGVARVSDFFQKNPSLKKICFLFEGVKVKEDWLVFYKESKFKNQNNIFSFIYIFYFILFFFGGGGGGEKGEGGGPQ